MAAAPARADFAPAPDEPLYRDARLRYPESEPQLESPYEADSTVRFQIGPAMLMQPTTPGLFAAVDVGKRAVGARLSGAWLRAESNDGLAAYTGELWVDFSRGSALHPIVGAGAAWLRGSGAGEHDSAGAAVLRGALEYELPVSDAEARVGVNFLTWVPAIGTERERPWVAGALTVGAGF